MLTGGSQLCLMTGNGRIRGRERRDERCKCHEQLERRRCDEQRRWRLPPPLFCDLIQWAHVKPSSLVSWAQIWQAYRGRLWP